MNNNEDLVFIQNIQSITAFISLMDQRNRFENDLYDYFENGNILIYQETIPDTFWEPVKVAYNNLERLEDIIGEDTCVICTDKHLNFKKMHCCFQKMCNGCCYEWFEGSVKCPYCYQDLRDFD